MQTTFDPSYEAGPAHIELRGEDERCNKRKQGEPAALVDHAHADIRIVHRRFKASIACLLLFTCSLCWIVYHAFTEQSQWSASSCAMAWMSPGYIRQDGLNASHSRLAGKYSLWLYREQGWDISSKPHGTPVLFAPGNAGSYRQVRSLAAAAARQYYSSPGKPDEALLSRHHQELDFFAADFNEDFSAFHAGTLKEQAEYLADCVRYVLSLYEDQGELAPSSVIVLAHSMGGIAARHMFLQPDFSAETVKTLVTLSTPHALPPATFDRGVEEIYSRTNEFWRESYANSSGPLQDLLVISIAGGMADTMISSDYADISNLVPESHGFGVMTSSVPDLFSPVDHLAMMWCDQLRQHIVRGLIQSTDSQQVSRARPLEERLATMQCQLLGDLALPSSPATILRQITFSRKDLQGPMHTVSLPQGTAVHDQLFFMSGATPKQDATVFQSTSTEDSVNVEYFMCEAAVDIMICHQLEAPIRTQIPKSGTAAKGSAPPLYHTELVLPESNDVLLLKISKPLEGMLLANFRPAEIEDLRSFSGMSLADWTSTTDDDSMVSAGGSRFRFPNLDSSLVVYKLNIRSAACEPTFPPVVRAYTASLREGFYFSGDTEATRLHLHTGAPYSDVKTDGLHLQSWADPACPVNLRLSIDLKASLGTLVIRYRSIMASWPTFVTLGMLRRILSPWKGSRTNINASTMQDALQQYLLEDLPLWTGLAVLSGLAQAVLSDRETFSSYSSTLLLGTKHLLFLLLVPVFLAVAISAIVVSHLLLRVIFPSVRLLSANGPNIPVLRRELREERSRTRMTAFALLGVFVTIFAPHQFAVLALFLLHGLTTYRCYAIHPTSTYEVNHAILLLLLWILPQNGAILVVWLRNLQAGWWWPLPSDHNLLAIIGPLLLIEQLRGGRQLTLPSNVWIIRVTEALFTGGMAIVLLWGGRYVFVVGEVVNVILTWLALLQYGAVRKRIPL